MAVKSELQYLRVWTTRGAALVLGSLQEMEDEEGSAGLENWRLLVSMNTMPCKAKLNATAVRLRRPNMGMTN
jgi:hypothetical protein